DKVFGMLSTTISSVSMSPAFTNCLAANNCLSGIFIRGRFWTCISLPAHRPVLPAPLNWNNPLALLFAPVTWSMDVYFLMEVLLNSCRSSSTRCASGKIYSRFHTSSEVGTFDGAHSYGRGLIFLFRYSSTVPFLRSLMLSKSPKVCSQFKS